MSEVRLAFCTARISSVGFNAEATPPCVDVAVQLVTRFEAMFCVAAMIEMRCPFILVV